MGKVARISLQLSCGQESTGVPFHYDLGFLFTGPKICAMVPGGPNGARAGWVTCTGSTQILLWIGNHRSTSVATRNHGNRKAEPQELVPSRHKAPLMNCRNPFVTFPSRGSPSSPEPSSGQPTPWSAGHTSQPRPSSPRQRKAPLWSPGPDAATPGRRRRQETGQPK